MGPSPGGRRLGGGNDYYQEVCLRAFGAMRWRDAAQGRRSNRDALPRSGMRELNRASVSLPRPLISALGDRTERLTSTSGDDYGWRLSAQLHERLGSPKRWLGSGPIKSLERREAV